MNLKQLLSEGRLKRYTASQSEVKRLEDLIYRDIKDAKVKGISSDRRFTIAYNAVLQTATMLLYSNGYKARGSAYHTTVFAAMRDILGEEYHDLADYFESCHSKRNLTEHSSPDAISSAEAEELIKEAQSFLKKVLAWVKNNCPALVI